MGEYVETPRLTTWYDSSGSGEPLVLLHGGMVTNESWAGQIPALADRFEVFAPERRGHGHTADVEGPLMYADMAADTIEFLEAVVGQPAHLVGWSDGGIVGLLVTLARQDLVRKLVMISANFKPAAESGLAEAQPPPFIDPEDETLGMFRSMHATSSPDGPEHWPVFVEKYFAMLRSNQPDISTTELAGVSVPTLVVAADDDIVRLEHTLELYRAIPDSELAVTPGTSHALIFEKPGLVNDLVLDFLATDTPSTMMPFRRAPALGRPGH
jgi:pimeloyl-ACP methyl ester carboxylesterase